MGSKRTKTINHWGATRREIETVFGFTGGELDRGIWNRRKWHYAGAPDWATRECEAKAREAVGDNFELVTAIECRLYGTCPIGADWQEIACYISSGEHVDSETGKITYIGEGWCEVVYTRPTLPDNVEIFHVSAAEARDCRKINGGAQNAADLGLAYKAGWWHRFCFPGCLPEGDAIGPFRTAKAAERDAIRHHSEG